MIEIAKSLVPGNTSWVLGRKIEEEKYEERYALATSIPK
jgi:hypothetical protein